METAGVMFLFVVFAVICAEVGMVLGHALACLCEWMERRRQGRG